MTRKRLALFQKFIEDLKGIKPVKAGIFHLKGEREAEYNSLLIGKTKICLQ
jgi:hypothetical protein